MLKSSPGTYWPYTAVLTVNIHAEELPRYSLVSYSCGNCKYPRLRVPMVLTGLIQLC